MPSRRPHDAAGLVDDGLDALATAVGRTRRWSIAETTSGRVVGAARFRTVRFAGVPYAAPPVGERRFRPPAPAPPWAGVRDTMVFAPQALQQTRVRRYPFGPRRSGESEDCLTLDVTTPGVDARRRPVMVWIHPGAFVDGAGSWVLGDGAALAASGDVVVVTINYRLGPFGWLHLDHLDGAGDGDGEHGDGGATNLGLLDQMAALRWVQDNIESFGGDPGRVTVFGASAGGLSIAALLAAPAAAGLFHRAIIQSGPLAHAVPVERAVDVADRVARRCGAASLAELRAVDAGRLLEAQAQVSFELAMEHAARPSPHGQWPLGPVVDGRILPRAPLDAAARGEVAPVPLVIGTNRDEWQVFSVMSRTTTTDEELRAWLGAVAGPRSAAVLDTYRGSVGDDPTAVKDAVMTDQLFTVPSARFAEAHRSLRPDATYSYLFARSVNPQIGATHGAEQPFVFGRMRPWHLASSAPLIGIRPPRRLMVAMRDAWTAFARTGDPNHPRVPEWDPLGAAGRVAVFDDPVVGAPHPLADRLAVWAPPD